MGPVLYPINSNAIEDLEPAERALLKSTILIEFDMGDLEMTPSREALSYGSDEPTIPSIRAKLRRIVNEIVSTFQAEYDACSTYWEACVLFRTHVNAGSAPEPVRDALRKKAQWKGKQLVTDRQFQAHELPGIEACIMTGSKLNNSVFRFSKSPDPTIPFKNKTIIYIEEEATDQRAPSKIKYDHSRKDPANRPDTVIWLRTRTPSRRYAPVGTMEKLQAFYEVIEGAEIVMVADLPEAPRTVYGGGGSGVRSKVQVRLWDGYDFDTRVDVDYEDGGYYVPLERMEPIYPGGMESPRYMWKALIDAGVTYAHPLFAEKTCPVPFWKTRVRLSSSQNCQAPLVVETRLTHSRSGQGAR